MKRKILIIGANSALAQATIPVLAAHNTIITAGREHCDVYCDVTNKVMIPDGVNVVINFAASFGGTNDKEIIDAQKTNSLGSLNVCVAAKEAGVKHVIIISSLSATLDEKSPYYSAYAITKRHADELASFYCQLHKIPLTILRPSQIYGDDSSFVKHQPFFHEVIDKAQSGQDISIYGNNDALRNYIHCADLAEIIHRVILKGIVGIYPCMSPNDITFTQIVQTAQKIFNKGGKAIFLKDKPNIPDNIFAKDLTIYEKVDYYPKVSLETGLKRIKEYRNRS